MINDTKDIGADAAKLAGLQVDLLQKIREKQITLEQLKWFNNLSKVERDRLYRSLDTAPDKRFKLVNTFELWVPDDYLHLKQLEQFKEENFKKFIHFDENITDANFAKVSHKIVPGRTYTIGIFQISGQKGPVRISPEECLKFLRRQKAILVGPQGLALIWQLHRTEFPENEWLLSFDEKDSLPFLNEGGILMKGGYHGLPYMHHNYRPKISDSWLFGLSALEAGVRESMCLLCVRE